MASHIKVNDDKKTICLKLNENGNLTIGTLTQYFPKARGLVYQDINGQAHGVDVVLGELIINPKIQNYSVHIVEDNSPNLSISNNKRWLVKEMLHRFESKENKELNLNSKSENKIKTLHKPSKPFLNIKIGLLYRENLNCKYSQYKKPMGGKREVQLLRTESYNVNDIKKLAIAAFSADKNLTNFNNLMVELGFYNGQIIESFNNANGEPCDFWEYIKCNEASKINLFLLTTPKSEDAVETEDQNEPKKMKIIHDQLITEDSIEILYEYIKKSHYTNNYTFTEFPKNDLHSYVYDNHDFISLEEFDPLNYGYRISKIIKNRETLLEISIDENLKRKYNFPSKSLCDLVPHSVIYDFDELYGINDGKFGIGVIPYCTDECRTIFEWYKNDQLIKKGMFLYWLPIENINNVSDYTCMIYCQNDPNKSTSTPSITKDNSVENSCCTVATCPIEDPIQISCTSSSTNEDTYLIEETSYTAFSLPLIERKELNISKKILGAGAQGKIREGCWLGTEVAVKTINISNANVKIATRELNILEKIRHPNIIQTLAVCLEMKQIHIVMELFVSTSLSEILFDEEVKKEYNLNNEVKKDIALQICKAVSYLHCQKNYIVHRDLKPQNILVNLMGNVKLCDLGLSKFCETATFMRTTIGSNSLKGTPMYMAPELFEKKEATKSSDIWAIGCTLVELYTEESVWDFQSIDDLKKVLKSEILPNLQLVPETINSIIAQCFSREPNIRPNIADLLKSFSS